MPSRFDKQARAKAVRLLRDHVGDYESEWAAIKAVSARLGTSAETLRRWIRQSDVDAGQAPGVPTESARAFAPIRQLGGVKVLPTPSESTRNHSAPRLA